MRIERAAERGSDESPLELLFACHERIGRFTRLAIKLAAHVQDKGADAEAQQAATSILRYFEQALPNHHADEEQDVFPAVLALNEPDVNAVIDHLLRQHQALDAMWVEVQPWLKNIVAGQASIAPTVLPIWVAEYANHTAAEERSVFPAVVNLPAASLVEIALSMRLRRGDKC